MNILVSACLMGVECRYNGKGEVFPSVAELMQTHTLIPVCPEIFGGLPTPRTPAERIGDRVVTEDGQDVTEAFFRGAEQVKKLAELYGCTRAILKERSPSCGCGEIYDGSFQRKLIKGEGITAEYLKQHGILVAGETNFKDKKGFL